MNGLSPRSSRYDERRGAAPCVRHTLFLRPIARLSHVFAATEIGYSTFDVAPGGDRFLVNAVSEEDATLPISVVVR